VTPAEARRTYQRARADWYRTKTDPNSPRHHAALIAAEHAAAVIMAARMVAHSASRRTA